MSGTIKTEFSNSWDRWLYNGQFENGQIRTEFNESWNRWKINGFPFAETMYIRTQFSGDNTRWVVSTSSSANIAELKTEFSNDYRRWELRYDPNQVQLNEIEIIPLLFIGVFTASVYEQGVHE